jgi:hypothetical protein
MTRVRRTVAVVATLAAAALSTTAQGEAHADSGTHAATGAEASSKAPAKTTLHLHFKGCDRCSVQLQHAVTGRPHVWTSTSKRIGADHRVVFRLRTSRTAGLSFVLRAPWEGGTGAVPNIVTRYAGHAIDSHVTRTAARHARRAEGCWAGTRLDDVRLDFRVARVPGRTLDGHRTQMPLVYATHSMSSWKPLVRTYKGTIGNQDAFYCTKPPTTQVTLTAANCDGCEIGVINGATRPENVWAVDPKTMKHDRVAFRIPRNQTRGLTATVTAPWEGTTGYTTVLAFRYAGHHVGDPVTFKDARSQRHASPCWGGTRSTALTLPLTIRKVTVAGNFGPTPGTVAYADITQSWRLPMMRAYQGVLGSQEVIVCGR